MTTNDNAVTAADYAAGLRALADFLEAAGLPASVRFPTLPLGIQLTVTSAEAVKDFALAHDLSVTARRHTKTVVALGPSPDTYYDGSIELTVVYVPDEAEDTAAEEPEATGVDTYDCPEPGCSYSVSAAGPLDPDEPDYYNEGIEEHERGHRAAEPAGALTAESSIRDSGIEDDLDAPVPYVPVDPDDSTSMALPVIGDTVLLHDGRTGRVVDRDTSRDKWAVKLHGRGDNLDGATILVTIDEIVGYPEESASSVPGFVRHTNEPCDLVPRFSSQAGVAAHQYSPTRFVTPPRTFGYNVVTVDPNGNPGGPRLDGTVTREQAKAELDELAPFMVDGYTTVLVELREVSR